MFKPRDKVEINNNRKCGSLRLLFQEYLDAEFLVMDLGNIISCICQARGSWKHDIDCDRAILDRMEPQYWVTIKLPDGRTTRISSYWLVLKK